MKCPVRALLVSTALAGASGAALATDGTADVMRYLSHRGHIDSLPHSGLALEDGGAGLAAHVDSRTQSGRDERTVLGASRLREVRNLVGVDLRRGPPPTRGVTVFVPL